MDSPPKNKPFWMAGFAVHATRGVLRDQSARRKLMFGLLLIAMAMLFCGSTFLYPLLRPHPVWFIVYWVACGWLTLTTVLLALLDLLMARIQARSAARVLREQYARGATPESQSDRANDQ